MYEISGDMFVVAGDEGFDALCITTNGFVKNNGNAVMGRGCAKMAAARWPELPAKLGEHIRTIGNTVGVLKVVEHEGRGVSIINFPVKPSQKRFNSIEERNAGCVQHMVGRWGTGDLTIPGWAVKADINLIRESARELAHLTSMMNWQKVILPRPGCGAGELDWADVLPVLQDILDDRFYATTFGRI